MDIETIVKGLEWFLQVDGHVTAAMVGIGVSVAGYTLKNHKKWEGETRYNENRALIRANYHASLKTPGGEYFDKQR